MGCTLGAARQAKSEKGEGTPVLEKKSKGKDSKSDKKEERVSLDDKKIDDVKNKEVDKVNVSDKPPDEPQLADDKVEKDNTQTSDDIDKEKTCGVQDGEQKAEIEVKFVNSEKVVENDQKEILQESSDDKKESGKASELDKPKEQNEQDKAQNENDLTDQSKFVSKEQEQSQDLADQSKSVTQEEEKTQNEQNLNNQSKTVIKEQEKLSNETDLTDKSLSLTQKIVDLEQVVSESIENDDAKPEDVVSEPVENDVAKPEDVVSEPIENDVAKPEDVVPEPIENDVAKPADVVSEPIENDVAKPEDVVPEVPEVQESSKSDVGDGVPEQKPSDAELDIEDQEAVQRPMTPTIEITECGENKEIDMYEESTTERETKMAETEQVKSLEDQQQKDEQKTDIVEQTPEVPCSVDAEQDIKTADMVDQQAEAVTKPDESVVEQPLVIEDKPVEQPSQPDDKPVEQSVEQALEVQEKSVEALQPSEQIENFSEPEKVLDDTQQALEPESGDLAREETTEIKPDVQTGDKNTEVTETEVSDKIENQPSDTAENVQSSEPESLEALGQALAEKIIDEAVRSHRSSLEGESEQKNESTYEQKQDGGSDSEKQKTEPEIIESESNGTDLILQVKKTVDEIVSEVDKVEDKIKTEDIVSPSDQMKTETNTTITEDMEQQKQETQNNVETENLEKSNEAVEGGDLNDGQALSKLSDDKSIENEQSLQQAVEQSLQQAVEQSLPQAVEQSVREGGNSDVQNTLSDNANENSVETGELIDFSDDNMVTANNLTGETDKKTESLEPSCKIEVAADKMTQKIEGNQNFEIIQNEDIKKSSEKPEVQNGHGGEETAKQKVITEDLGTF